MERSISFKNFRNLGIGNPERIVLNHSLEKGKMGELVILIGPNNAGKSNVLDGIKKYSIGKLNSEDVTLLKIEEEYQKPKIRLTVKDDDTYYREIGIDPSETYVNRIDASKKEISLTKEEEIELIDIVAKIRTKINFDEFKSTTSQSKYDDSIAIKQFCESVDKKDYLKGLINYHASTAYTRYKGISTLNYYDKERCQALLDSNKLIRNSSGFKTLYVNDYLRDFENKYKIPLVPHIYEYKEIQIVDANLNSSPSQISNNHFFKSLFTDEDFKAIKTTYENINKYKAVGLLDNLDDRFKDKLDNINKIFNSMYFAEKDKYSFSLKFESNIIYFKLKRGSKVIVLNQQSTGFKWFFNFYFNFINSENLKMGDIIVMDEPATNLHPKGQEELRRFIKELARKNDLTFIIATHSPFMIDTDNYDEIRVLSIDDNVAHINNLFTVLDNDDPDSLLPIKQALTIERNVLYREKTKIVFVEGITDYNYLTMFKNMLKKDNLAFLPFQGVGKNKDTQKKILISLTKIGRKDSTVLTDSDKPAADFKRLSKELNLDLNVLNLNEIDSSFTEIESLFSEQDIKTYELDKKNAHQSSLIKNICSKSDFTQQTINNFEKLLDQLELD